MRNDVKPAHYDIKLRVQQLRAMVLAFLFVEALYWNRVLKAQALGLRRAVRNEIEQACRSVKLRVLSFGTSVVAFALVATLSLERFLEIQAVRLRRALWNEIKQARRTVGLGVLVVGGALLALVLAETLYLGHSAVPVPIRTQATRMSTEFDFTKSRVHVLKATAPHA